MTVPDLLMNDMRQRHAAALELQARMAQFLPAPAAEGEESDPVPPAESLLAAEMRRRIAAIAEAR